MDLVYRREKPLFVIALIVSLIFLVTIGLFVLLYIPLIVLFYLFVQSGFIAYIKGTGVLVSPDQYPHLHEKMQRHCENLGIDKVPDAYVLNSDGILNALATKFLGRYYIVLYSDVVDALAERPGAIDFYIGHELGHVARNHLNWSFPLFPSRILPVLGTAHARAQEYTCDSYGYACCENAEDAAIALGVLAAGTDGWKTMNIEAYGAQVSATGGFWMSFHKFTSTYPWLIKRVERLLAAGEDDDPSFPRRNPFAFLISIFVPNIGVGGAGGLIVWVAIIGILAAVGLPAYQDYINTANAARAEAQIGLGGFAATSLDVYILENQAYPESFAAAGVDVTQYGIDGEASSISIEDAGVVFTFSLEGAQYSVVFEASLVSETEVGWECSCGNLPEEFRPASCP